MSKFHDENAIYIDKVAIRVMDVDKSIAFYNNTFGFKVINRQDDHVKMGVSDRVLLILKNAKTEKEKRAAGLYHIAFLVPNRVDLANWLMYHINSKTSFIGASNHDVSEAIYLEDIDGNGIEVYTDTPRENWKWNHGQVKMVTEALDLDSLFSEITIPTNALPKNTIIGHIHLSVLNTDESQKFYHLLGFNTVLDMGNAAFMSSQEYHHHIGMNVWGMRNASPHITTQADIDYFVVKYPSKDILNETLKTLKDNGYEYIKSNEIVEINDVNGINIHLVA